MNFEERHTFSVPASTVMRMYTDAGFFARKYEQIGAIEAERLEHVEAEDHFSVCYRLVLPSDAPIPEAVRKLLGPTVCLQQRDSWTPSKRLGRLDIDIKGVPVKVGADMELIEENGTAVNVQRWAITCGIPLIGGKVESALAQDIRIKSARDLAASRRLVSGY